MANDRAKLAIEITANGSQATSAITGLQGTVDELTNKIGSLVLGFASFGTAIKVFDDANKAAEEAETSMKLLENAINNTKDGTYKLANEMNNLALNMALTTGVSENEAREGLVKLTQTTGDAVLSMRIFNTAMLVSKGTGKDLALSMDTVLRGYELGAQSLKRMQIYFDKNYVGEELLVELNKRYAGSLEAVANTGETTHKKLDASWTYFKENIGDAGWWKALQKHGAELNVFYGNVFSGKGPSTEAQSTEILSPQIKNLDDLIDKQQKHILELKNEGAADALLISENKELLSLQKQRNDLYNAPAGGDNKGTLNAHRGKDDFADYENILLEGIIKKEEEHRKEVKKLTAQYKKVGEEGARAFEKIGGAIVKGNMAETIRSTMMSIVDIVLDGFIQMAEAAFAGYMAIGAYPQALTAGKEIVVLSGLKGAIGGLSSMVDSQPQVNTTGDSGQNSLSAGGGNTVVIHNHGIMATQEEVARGISQGLKSHALLNNGGKVVNADGSWAL
jgi:hypothetical protein